MQFVKEAPFLDRKGTVVVLPPGADRAEPVALTNGFVLSLLFNAYSPGTGLKLEIPEYRTFGKVQDVLEAGPENGFFKFEDSHFELLKRVCLHMAVCLLLPELNRNSPQVEELLNSATARLPKELDELKPKKGKGKNGVKPAEAAKEEVNV